MQYALFLEEQPIPNSTDRRKAGSKHHVAIDGQGISLMAVVTAAEKRDVTQLVALVPPSSRVF